jgi:hypothetical protein
MMVDRQVMIVPESRLTRKNFLRELRFTRKIATSFHCRDVAPLRLDMRSQCYGVFLVETTLAERQKTR